MVSTKRLPARWLLSLAFLLSIALAGCVTLKDPESFQEQNPDVVGVASAHDTIGQTLVSRRARLNGVWLWLSLQPASPDQTGTLTVELHAAPLEGTPLASASLSLGAIQGSGPILVQFPAQPGPAGQTYYLSLSTDRGQVQVRGRSADVYPQGSAFLNYIPLEGDLAFRLAYEYGASAILQDLLDIFQGAWLLIPLGLVLFLPGWLLLDWSGLASRFDAGERAALSLGLSLSLIPLVMSWTSLLHLPWNRTGLLFVCGVLSALAFWRLRGRMNRRWFSSPGQQSLALAGILLLTLFVRMAMVRDLAAPPWVDSVHHATLTRLILEQGVYPSSYSPYIEIDSPSYHAGYHSLLASFLWLSSLQLERGMLVFGQVLNALAILAVYLLATSLSRDSTTAVFAALIAGLFTPMPAYYTSWGRYTQLAGLLVLPAVIILLTRLFEASLLESNSDSLPTKRKLVILAGISISGLILVHYRVAAFAACLLAADLLTRLPAYFRRHPSETLAETPIKTKLIPGIAWPAVAGFLGLLMVSPWLYEAFTTLLLPKWNAWSPGRPALFAGFTWTYLNTAWGKPAMLLAALGFVAALLRRQRLPYTLLIWVAALFTLANLGSLGLPGNAFVNNISVEIMLFMPLSLLGGYFLSQLVVLFQRFTPPNWHRPAMAAGWLAGSLTALFAAQALLPILNPITFLYRAADRPALEWIAANVPETETVLINPYAWGYGLYAGNDGGYWIAPLAGRPTMPPPVLYGLDNNQERVRGINQFSQKVIESGSDPAALYDLMLADDLRYLYIGARGGPLSVPALLENPFFEPLYNHGNTWVFYRK
ncbi:MAG TPA: hypothetical protein VLA49_11035 [Anaerolineales bacterium]|nr:hypothetical protein [Anaerolineales bacterium]